MAILAGTEAASGRSNADHGTVRVAALMGITPLLRERNLEPDDILASVGLVPGTLDNPDRRISYRTAGALLQRCAGVTGCAHFGLLVGQQANVSSLGTLGELMKRSPNVRTALRNLLLHLHLQTCGAVPTHAVEGNSATFGYAIYLRDMTGTAQAYDLVMAFEFLIMKTLCGPRWCPSEVLFSHAKPPDIQPYRQFFGSALRFDADRTTLVFNRKWLDHRLASSDSERYRALQRELAAQEMREPADEAEQIRRALRTLVMNGGASESVVSRLLKIPQRSLRRLLASQGTSFRQLLNDAQYEIARQLLVDTAMTTNQIAEVLNYADASAFTRAFRRWTNTPPAAWRAKQAAEA